MYNTIVFEQPFFHFHKLKFNNISDDRGLTYVIFKTNVTISFCNFNSYLHWVFSYKTLKKNYYAYIYIVYTGLPLG